MDGLAKNIKQGLKYKVVLMDKDPLPKEFVDFVHALGTYLTFRLHKAGLNFEGTKNFVVDALLSRRGANTSLFIHVSILSLSVAVLFLGGVISSTSVVSGSYPGVPANPLLASSTGDSSGQGVISSTITPVTIVSDKPRDKIVKYEIKSGDTIASIAKEFGISEETILWRNELSASSKLTAGDTLEILPVSGVVHKVQAGDTIYSIAKTYRASAQAILDFPFNDISDDFQVASGEVLVIPDGTPPEKPKASPTQYLAQADISVTDLGSGQFIWPASGEISQYFSWYHPALDISNLGGGPIYASDGGTVTVAGYPDNSGYGNRVVIDHGNGYTTLYAHMSAIYVSPGQQVGKGEVLGAMGTTGRSTGVHLHIEIRKNGAALNPLGMLGR